MAIMYVQPPVDNVAPTYHVDTPGADENAVIAIEAVEEGIAVYLAAFCQKFYSEMGRKQRRICLLYFQRYLVAQVIRTRKLRRQLRHL